MWLLIREKVMHYFRKYFELFDKKTGQRVSVNEQLAEEINKPVTKKFKKRKVYARFKDNICAADFVEIESLSSKHKKC